MSNPPPSPRPDRLALGAGLRWGVVAGLAVIAAAYVVGALAGIALTLYNNELLEDAPRGSYLYWANLCGTVVAVVVVVPALAVSILLGAARAARRPSAGG